MEIACIRIPEQSKNRVEMESKPFPSFKNSSFIYKLVNIAFFDHVEFKSGSNHKAN